MSLWEFDACVEGWLRSQGQLKAAPMSDNRMAELGIEGFNGD